MSDNPVDWQARSMSPQYSLRVPTGDQQHSQESRSGVHEKNTITDAPVIQLPWWQSHLLGYPASILFVSVATVLSYLLKSFASSPYFLGQPFVFATVAVALLWGIGPALFTIALEYVTVDLFLIYPFHFFEIGGWGDLLTFGPFILAQLLIACLAIQSESRRRRLLKAKKAVEEEAREIERANRFKSLFLSIASHELKTPITAIKAQTQLALRRSARSSQTVAERPSLSPYLEKIEAETRRLHILVDDLLDLGSIDSGKISLQFAQCDLASICQKVVEDQQALSGRHIDLDIPSAPVLLQGDARRLTQVVINLVTNAVKYSPENCLIQASVRQNQTHAMLQVHNDGSVIPPQYREHIFEPFYRLPSDKQGWGLGLPICKEIVEGHSGRIWVESSEEAGTTFFVEIPYQPG
jgi:signal transduction histidine kinase